MSSKKKKIDAKNPSAHADGRVSAAGKSTTAQRDSPVDVGYAFAIFL